ncbi:hypothetical protein SFV1gp27 [Sulfolobus filamentous virus 1]|uniref:Uncharacterized protein n=2 Tax=Alphalipothrixvirus beppuense TaxID=2734584 RepID=A0A346LU66_SUFV1|nr:hypothetical protein HOT91_gp27 [Sulfolobus filamentous virus 1]AXQ00109.1 hypothetical protein SFV1gp27 [Sulfolobus filamentous virus 1]AZI75729.1 hypothetical protein SBFV1_gp28 [Sulfolobales Beppu filamentous phage 1]
MQTEYNAQQIADCLYYIANIYMNEDKDKAYKLITDVINSLDKEKKKTVIKFFIHLMKDLA